MKSPQGGVYLLRSEPLPYIYCKIISGFCRERTRVGGGKAWLVVQYETGPAWAAVEMSLWERTQNRHYTPAGDF